MEPKLWEQVHEYLSPEICSLPGSVQLSGCSSLPPRRYCTSFLHESRRKFPPVSGGVIEDVRFLGDDRLLVGYYGGVSIFSTEPGTSGMMLEYGVSQCRSG